MPSVPDAGPSSLLHEEAMAPGEDMRKMKKTRPGLQPLKIPQRQMSYSLNMNALGLATFSYSSRDNVTGLSGEHILTEKGEDGFSLNSLAIGPELGHGQGGSVRLARHAVSSVLYALKEVNMCDQETRHQVCRELAVYRECQQHQRHPNIVAMHDGFYSEGRVYMVLELMTWGSLELALFNRREQCLLTRAKQRSEKKSYEFEGSSHCHEAAVSLQGGKRRAWAMEEPVLVGVAGKILRALDFLFKNHNIVHRDIKPGLSLSRSLALAHARTLLSRARALSRFLSSSFSFSLFLSLSFFLSFSLSFFLSLFLSRSFSFSLSLFLSLSLLLCHFLSP